MALSLGRRLSSTNKGFSISMWFVRVYLVVSFGVSFGARHPMLQPLRMLSCDLRDGWWGVERVTGVVVVVLFNES